MMDDVNWREAISISDKITKSPIERLLLGALACFIGVLEISRIRANIQIIPQHTVGRHRIDIAVISEHINLAIECDGHEFHEKTKEQASRDKERKRTLTTAGWTVIEFTGSEIWRDPFSCVEQIANILAAQAQNSKDLRRIK